MNENPEQTSKELFPSASVEPPSIEQTMAGNPAASPPAPGASTAPTGTFIQLAGSSPSTAPTGTFIQAPGSTPSVPTALILTKEVSVPPEYEVLGELGRGGMGVVYKARHRKLNRVVALKMILSGSHASRDEELRFLAEAESVAALSHPNIVQIFEIGQHNGLPYFTLEFIAGGSLGSLVKEHPLEPKEAARIVEQIARGMDYAHLQGIVHRDLKPENILLTHARESLSRESGIGNRESGKDKSSQNVSAKPHAVSSDSRFPIPDSRLTDSRILTPKITDFGLAKKVEGGSGLTASGAIMGTPSFMAPEQAKGDLKNVGPLADVYAVGAILYRLITGKPPFQAATVMDTVMQVLNQEPVPPTQLSSKIPSDLETICLKCLQKDPARRYSSCAELADDLLRFLEGKPIQARPVSSLERAVRWCKRNPTVTGLLAGIALILVAATIVSTLLSIEASKNADTASKNADEAKKAAKLAEDREKEVRLAMDEVKTSNRKTENLFYATRINLAYREWLAGNAKRANQNLAECPDELRGWEWDFLRSLDREQSIEMRGHEQGVLQAEFFSQGKQAMSISLDGTLRYWDTQTGTQFDQGPKNFSIICLSPDQKLFAGAQNALIYVGETETGRKHFEFTLTDSAPVVVQFVQKGSKIATCSERGKIRLHDAATGKLEYESKFNLEFAPTVLQFARRLGANRFEFSPDGQLIAFPGTEDRVQVRNIRTGDILLNDKDHVGFVQRCIFHPQEPLIATSGFDGLIRIWDIGQKKILHELQGHSSYVHALAFSPDGEQLISGGKDQTLRVWKWANEQQQMILRGHTGDVVSIRFDASGRYAISSGLDAMIRVWDLQSRIFVSPEVKRYYDRERVRHFSFVGSQDYLQFFSYGGPGARLAISPDGTFGVTSGLGDNASKEQVVVWNLEERREVKKLPITGKQLHSMAFTPDGKGVLVATSGGVTPDPGELRFFDTTHWQEKWKWMGPLSIELAPVFSPDGKRLIGTSQTTSGQNFLIAWNPEDGSELYRQPLSEVITRGCFNSDGSEFLFGGIRSGTIHVHDVATGTRNRVWQASPFVIVDVACSKKNLLAITSNQGNISLIDLATQQPVRTLEGHLDTVLSLAFNPEGDRLFSGSIDLTSRVWQVDTGYELLAFRDYKNAVQQVAWTNNGGKIGTISADGSMRIWEAPTRTLPPDTREWKLLHRDDFRSTLSAESWRPGFGSVWQTRDGRCVGRLAATRYQSVMFGMAQLLLQKVELPRSFEARVKFKMPRPLAVGFVLTDPRTRRSLVPLVTESGNQLGRPSVYVQQFSTLDGVLRLVPIKESRKYTLPPGAERELRIVRIEDDLRVFVDGIEQLHEPIPLLDFTEIGLQVSDNATEGEILVWDFELRAPEKAIREQAMRTRIGKLFDEIGFKEGVRDAIRDEKRSPAERELVEKELERLVEDPWKIMTLLDAKLVEGTKPTELPQLLKQAEYLVKLAPNEWKFLMPLGVVQYRSGKYAEAIETINRSIELHRTETGSVRPVQYAQLALGYHKLNRPEEAKRMARRMYDLLNYSDHWKKDGVELTVTYEARKLFEEKETPDHEAIKRVVSRSDQDGWVLRKLDAHLSAYDPSYRFRWQRHEKPSSDDIELSFEQIRKMKQYQIPGPISSENWIDFDEMEVTVDGDRAKLNTRAGVHFGRGFDVYRSNFELRKVNGEWKLTANIAWLLEQRQEGVVVRFDEAWYREQEAIAAKLKSSDDFRGYAQLLLKLKQLAKLVAFIDQMPEGERTAEFLKIKGEALFELGKVSEAFAMFREAIKQAPALEMPWYLNPVKHQWRPDEQVGSSVVWLKDSRLLAGSGNDRRVHVWNVETGQEEFTLPETEFSIFSLAVSPDGESLAGSLGDGRILIWNLKTKESTAMCIGHTKVVYRIAFDSTGKRLVSASGDTTARVWDATNGKQLLEIRGHEDEVLGAHFSPDGTQIATASHDRTARIWDATTGKELKKFVGHQGHVKRVVWSKDGKRLFTASLDATARIWDVEKQKEIRRLVGHSSGLDVIALSPDETRIVTADFAGIVRLWDGSNYKLLRSHDRTGRPIYSLAIDAENRYLATAGADGYLVYRLQEFPE